MSLNGTLDVMLLDDFLPMAGDEFEILAAAGGIIGTFDTLLLPAIACNLVLDVVHGANTVSLVALLPGDYNFDGSVDAVDYVVCRKNVGTQDGYDTWRGNFGPTAGGGESENHAAVPEATGAAIMLLVSLVVLKLHRRRISSEKSSRRA